ncbi:GntR family transcriptional regulator [Microbacterium azadirachtae]|uniref:HTH-type transcriptional regulator LutR n=1 Tax=Microbacterium azadirachtae TaxID=582680 RepID=A0A0F0L299_9MICO|nr:GntR family transcriptional regulator [Microbacterium azadirachtae]KJL27248.1 HTH-type transcriptional regulator LutR [Microbacterium azadirachtae]SDM49959.1 DNA-binding transcriptional regulator, GntR family [Microbacterium azadirachtae]SEG58990.1 DNA-binding transcriptional regulator, GntR family [Microbacterium azadirachtae]SEG62643.1 DNA-binding transcriptional regulator, GntR family [Microbacterium azadirachtae]
MTSTDVRQLESTRIAAWLRDAILDGVRAPGSRLIERDLASEFGVSRVPVRDALKVLVAEGLVELRPHTWAVVREFTEADLADLDEVRAVLEPLTFRLAAERRRQDGLGRLQESLEAEQSGARDGDGIGSRRAAADFHEIVTELAENRLLSDMMKGIRSRLRWALSQHDDLQHISEEHVALFEAIRAGDGERAADLAAAHVDTSRRARVARVQGLRAGDR